MDSHGHLKTWPSSLLLNSSLTAKKLGLCDLENYRGWRKGHIMQSKRRSNDVIVSQILKICIHGASKTRIVYQANMNFMTVGPYLDNLIKSGCIESIPEGSRIIYRTTPKGMDLKERLERFQSDIDNFYSVGAKGQEKTGSLLGMG